MSSLCVGSNSLTRNTSVTIAPNWVHTMLCFKETCPAPCKNCAGLAFRKGSKCTKCVHEILFHVVWKISIQSGTQVSETSVSGLHALLVLKYQLVLKYIRICMMVLEYNWLPWLVALIFALTIGPILAWMSSFWACNNLKNLLRSLVSVRKLSEVMTGVLCRDLWMSEKGSIVELLCVPHR